MLYLLVFIFTLLIHAEPASRQLLYCPNTNMPAPNLALKYNKSEPSSGAAHLYFTDLNAEQELYVVDFEASEKSFQLVNTKVALTSPKKATAVYYQTLSLPNQEGGWGIRFVIKEKKSDGRRVFKDKGVIFYPGKSYYISENSFRFRRAELSADE